MRPKIAEIHTRADGYKDGETWVAHMIRTFSQAVALLDKQEYLSADAIYLKAYHSHCGHVARMAPGEWLTTLIQYRDLSWWKQQREVNPAKRPRHCRKGGHQRFATRIDKAMSTAATDWKEDA